MIKSQFIILGILSLIAVVGSTSTISHAVAEVQTSDVLGLLDKASSGVKGSDIGPIVDKAKPDFSALKSLADKFASVPSTSDLLNSLGNPTSTPPVTTANSPQ
jgi:hypothetical protein